MTKSEFVKGMILFRREQEDLNKRVIRLKKEWILDNTKFKIGDMVMFKGREYKIKKIDVDVSGRIIYHLRKKLAHGGFSSFVNEESDSSQFSLIEK